MNISIKQLLHMTLFHLAKQKVDKEYWSCWNCGEQNHNDFFNCWKCHQPKQKPSFIK